MVYAKTIAKAIAAGLAVVATGIAAGIVPLEPWFEVAIMAVIAGIAVFIVPNSEG